MAGNVTEKKDNWLLRIHPLHRMLICLICSVLFCILLPGNMVFLLKVMLGWITFAFLFTLADWGILFTRPIGKIRKVAQQDDGSKVFVFAMIILSSFASLFTVLFLMISGGERSDLFVPVAIGGMILSWIMLHTLFTFNYAHLYYGDGKHGAAGGGLDFPGQGTPDYIDFAYFSFVIGCTFQVSDVVISSKTIRRRVLLHSLLSFALNTFVVALTINLVAGLSR